MLITATRSQRSCTVLPFAELLLVRTTRHGPDHVAQLRDAHKVTSKSWHFHGPQKKKKKKERKSEAENGAPQVEEAAPEFIITYLLFHYLSISIP